jgi:hypothetical protein
MISRAAFAIAAIVQNLKTLALCLVRPPLDLVAAQAGLSSVQLAFLASELRSIPEASEQGGQIHCTHAARCPADFVDSIGPERTSCVVDSAQAQGVRRPS